MALTLANQARDQRDWTFAAVQYRLYLRLKPRDTAIWVQLGHAEKEAGRWVESLVAYSEALRLAPDDPDLLLSLGHLHKLMGHRDEAIAYYRRSAAADGNNFAKDELRALGAPIPRAPHSGTTTPPRAAAINGHARATAAPNVTRWASRTVGRIRQRDLLQANQARDRRDWGSAVIHYRAHLQRRPEHQPIWVQLGHALKEDGRLDESVAAYMRALALNPHDSDLLLNLGHLHKVRGEFDISVDFYRRSAMQDSNPFALAELSDAGMTSMLPFMGAPAAPSVSETSREPPPSETFSAASPNRDPTPEDSLPANLRAELEVIRPEFNAGYYLALNEDVKHAGVEPLFHYVAAGWQEGRDPSPLFSTHHYLESYPDVAAAKLNPFYHFIVAGRSEGRHGKPPLGYRYEIISRLKSLEHREAESRRHAETTVPDSSEALAGALRRELSVSAGERLHISVSHDDFSRNIGGVQICLGREAGVANARGHDHVHLFPAAPLLVPDRAGSDALVGVLVNGKPAGFHLTSTVAAALAQLPAQRKARSFAVHSLLGHDPTGIVDVLRQSGCRSGYYWLHDYSSLCAGYTLLRNDVEFCGAPPAESGACRICVYGPQRANSVQAHNALFAAFDVTLLAPEQAALDIWSQAVDFRPKDARVHQHCQLTAPSKPPLTTPRAADRPLRIAFLGMPAAHKGWPVFMELVQRFGSDRRYAFHHLGKGQQRGFPIEFEEVRVTAVNLGAMQSAIERHEIDAALVWPQWPETFCFTAYEALAGGAGVITNTGAGNVTRLCGYHDHCSVLASDKELFAYFESGEALFAKLRTRPAPRFDLAFSGMTGDFLAEAAR